MIILFDLTKSKLTKGVQRVVFSLKENQTRSECRFPTSNFYLLLPTDDLPSDALSPLPDLQAALMAWPPAAALPDMARTAEGRAAGASRGCWDASSWDAEVWSRPWGRGARASSCVSKQP